MTLEESKKKAAKTQPVESDKFDRHMERARRSDIESRQEAFILQSEDEEEWSERINGLKSSVY